MAGLKYYERTKLLIELIEKEKTGSPRELANRLGVKERMVYRILDDLRLIVNEEIIFCKESKSYIFSKKNG
ncbi:HTH domain-containing protein [Algoriphagus marinus]|uniref:HTH domain-containing protein n=1 Tax=Algoriphagus marinus TaxID=1925762 RepID=UPI00094B8E66|nr:HTH domain-containing protein [Algoriphagus marinus]